MPLQDIIQEEYMNKFRSQSRLFREISKKVIQENNYDHIRRNSAKNLNKVTIDFSARPNRKRDSYNDARDTRIVNDKEVMDSFIPSKYSILFNIRGNFYGDEFHLGYRHDQFRGPIKVHIGSKVHELGNIHNINQYVNSFAEENPSLITYAPEKFIGHVLEYCNKYIGELKQLRTEEH